MTSYHFSIKKNTKSAKAHCDYILRENTKNTIEKKELIFTKNNLPKWANNNPKKFWSECDKRERVNGIKYRELEFTLQNELSLRENAKIMKGVLEKFCKNKYYTLVVHDKKQSSIAGERNLHCHLMFCERICDKIDRTAENFFKRYNPKNPSLGGAKKDRYFTGAEGKKNFIEARKFFEEITNKILKENGINEEISSLSLKEQRNIALKNGEKEKFELLNRTPEIHFGRKSPQKKEELILLLENRKLEQKRQNLIKIKYHNLNLKTKNSINIIPAKTINLKIRNYNREYFVFSKKTAINILSKFTQSPNVKKALNKLSASSSSTTVLVKKNKINKNFSTSTNKTDNETGIQSTPVNNKNIANALTKALLMPNIDIGFKLEEDATDNFRDKIASINAQEDLERA